MRDAGATRSRILDQAEVQYAHAGLTGFSLRDITEGAGVNLASVNYHFQSRKSLIKAMLVRALEASVVDQLALLRRVIKLHPDSLQPTHVMMCMVLPLMHDILSPSSSYRTEFVLRVSSDTDAWVREVMAETFLVAGAEYQEAFVKSAPRLGRTESLWRTALFCNVIPGNIANHSLIVMCQGLLVRKDSSPQKVMAALAMLAEVLLTGTTDTLRIASQVAETLAALEHLPVVSVFEDKMSMRGIFHG
jgi:AcrR family transcriptional regulator